MTFFNRISPMSLLSTQGAEVCTSAGCFLQKNGGLVSFPLVTIAGLIDGVNPCAIGMLVLLLGYLIVFARREKAVFKIGLTYILTVYITYLLVGLVFYRSVSFLSNSTISIVFRKVLGAILLIAGVVNIKDFILFYINHGSKAYKLLDSFHLEVPGASQGMLRKYIEKATIPATIILGVLVTLLETPCSLPIYVGTATILSQARLPIWEVAGYFIYYNFLFVLPLIILWLVIWKTKKLVEIREWEHRAKKWMKLSIGVLLVIMGIWMIW